MNVVDIDAMAVALAPPSEVVLGLEELESFALAVDLAVELLGPSELAQCWLLECRWRRVARVRAVVQCQSC